MLDNIPQQLLSNLDTNILRDNCCKLLLTNIAPHTFSGYSNTPTLLQQVLTDLVMEIGRVESQWQTPIKALPIQLTIIKWRKEDTKQESYICCRISAPDLGTVPRRLLKMLILKAFNSPPILFCVVQNCHIFPNLAK